ncbi:DUF4173 domain-containing protein [Parasedimentitalea marina]|uniref:DUF4173 domain-containing protein n=2 Tax=Parasedimentitalea marina TaxID=2483033 RepID=A0A3T0N124_9RHOB|nr:DUF4173 domain-containing protein [Parasedimentitalea marina]
MLVVEQWSFDRVITACHLVFGRTRVSRLGLHNLCTKLALHLHELRTGSANFSLISFLENKVISWRTVMSRQLVINGVPDCIQQDGWWLASDSTNAVDGSSRDQIPRSASFVKRHPWAFPALALLTLLADWLFWQQNLGLSVVLFALALSSSILALKPGGASRRETVTAFVFELACNLPVVEQLQPMSFLFTVIGIIVLIVWVAYGRVIEWWQAAWAFLRLSIVGPFVLPVTIAGEIKGAQTKVDLKQQTKALILPLSIGLVFLFLLTSANPILERFLDQFAALEFLSPKQIWRGLFWIATASLIWPYLNLREKWLGPVAKAPEFASTRSPWLSSIVNAESVRNSLILFNVLFLVQTVMDIGVLTGGMSLPDGMTFARYAHRGAYPLVATALIAGVFAIATHKMIKENRFQQKLLYLWLGQNLFLVITAAYRLSLYVDAYTLTYLRVSAFIWMLLVFAGLILTLVQVSQSKSISWLVRSNLVVLAATLYLCCFVNFAYVIASYNLQNATAENRFDERYICELGEQALPLILEQDRKTGTRMCMGYHYGRPIFEPISDWRDWGFRKWRLQAYLGEKLYR